MKRKYVGFIIDNIFSRNNIIRIMIEQMKEAEDKNPHNLKYYGFYSFSLSKLIYVNQYCESEVS